MEPSNENFDQADLVALLAAYPIIDDDDQIIKIRTTAFVLANPLFYRRDLTAGHITASAWIMDRARKYVLLTHHAKLGLWMQLGGHIEDDRNIRSAAMREATEESGLSELRFESDEILDIDIHRIPATAKTPEHLHYDVRFFLIGNMDEALQISSESRSLRWVLVEDIADFTTERSVMRMVEKSRCKGVEYRCLKST